MGVAFRSHLPAISKHLPAVKRVSQVNLSLHSAVEQVVFETARDAILRFVENRPGVGKLPDKAWAGESFSTDEIGTRRVEGIALDTPCYWSLRFDDEDNQVARRSWIMETALGVPQDGGCVLFGSRIQCAIGGENPPYNRSIPGFVRGVIRQCDARLDRRRTTLKPWTINTETGVKRLVELLRLPDREADVVVISLPEDSSDPASELVSSEKLAHDLAGAAYVVLISGPEFDPDADQRFAHPLSIAERIRNWPNGGPAAFQYFIVNEVLRRTVAGSGVLQRLPGFVQVKQMAAELRRRQTQESGSSDDDLPVLFEKEIEQLKHALTSQKKEYDALLESGEDENNHLADCLLCPIPSQHRCCFYVAILSIFRRLS